jgi:iron complex outermembrane receptor protein
VISASPFAVWTGVVPDASEVGRPQMSPDPLTGERFFGSERSVYRLSNVLDYELSHGTVRSALSYLHGEFYSRQDSDKDAILTGTPGSMIDISPRTGVQESTSEVDQYSAELRYSSDWDGPLQVIFGGLYWQEDAERLATTVSVTCAATIPLCTPNPNAIFPNINHTPDIAQRSLEHWSIYAQGEWSITPDLVFSAGVRHSIEDETVIGAVCGLPVNSFGRVCGDPFTTSAGTPSVFGPSSLLSDRMTVASAFAEYVTIEHEESFTTPQFVLEWSPSEDQMFYLSAARGVKPGGTSTVGAGAWFDSDLDGDTDELDYAAESLWAYELGAKSSWFDGALRSNIALFYQDYSDKQVATTIVTPSGLNAAIIENAGAARVQGAEVELSWRITDHLRLTGAYTHLNSEYTEFTFVSDSKSQIILGPGCEVVLVGTTPMCEIDLAGNSLERAPEHAAVVSLMYRRPDSIFGDNVGWYAETTVTYESERYVDQFNSRLLQEHSLTDLRFGLETEAWELGLYVTNVFDDDTIRTADVRTGDVDRYVVGGGVASGTNVLLVSLPEPRVFGARLKYRF